MRDETRADKAQRALRGLLVAIAGLLAPLACVEVKA